MAISRMDMERQLRAGGGIMTLEEPRQGYFLGKIVKKAKRAVKKVIKSPLGKTALLAGLTFGLPGTQFGGLLGRAKFGGAAKGIFGNVGGIGQLLGSQGKLSTLGDIFRVGGTAGAKFSVPRMLAGGLGAAAIAAPFLMGGDEEEEVPEESFTGPISSVEDIRGQAKRYYGDPTNSALYFMPQKSAVQSSFYAADGGLASIPRDGYRMGNVVKKAGEMIKAGMGKVKSLFDDADINVSIRDEDVLTDSGLQAQAVGQDVFITPKSNKAVQVMEELIDEGYDIAKAEDGTYAISSVDEGALDIITQRLRIGSKGADEFIQSQDYYGGPMDEESKMIYEALRNRKAEGGLASLDTPKRGMVDGPGSYAGEKPSFLDNFLSALGQIKSGQITATGDKAKEFVVKEGFGTNFDEDQIAQIIDMKNRGMDLDSIATIMEADPKEVNNLFSLLEQKAYGGRISKAEGGLMDLGGFEKDYREGGFVPLGAEERADDVPARLSKNEFVFTADAVRNAGQGDIDKGAEVMQNMMDNLEAGGTISEESQGLENPAQAMFDQAQQLESRIE